ncbi:MAG: ornithine cyclodeaminase family protein [Candidatus Omnitrophica bacterium]|nr:ornithine cyclodeaminase family protein [Candidatus Omnitrophota bacterium]
MSVKFRTLTDRDVRSALDGRTANRLCVRAFKAFADIRNSIPSKVYVDTPAGDFRAMPAWVHAPGILGVKWICVYPLNPKKNLPSVIGTLLLNDPDTGELLCVAEANELTAWRTGAAGAVASKACFPGKPKKIAVIGAGTQAHFQLDCHMAMFGQFKVGIWSQDGVQASAFAGKYRKSGIEIETADTIRDCVADADIVITVTPSRRPIVKAAWLKPGVHINAIGADAPGKQELEEAILFQSRVFVDDIEQSSHSGEINKSFHAGRFKRKNIKGTLSDILTQKKKARLKTSDPTVFDSTGLAVQDMVFADYVYRQCLKK